MINLPTFSFIRQSLPAPFHQASLDRGSLIACSKWNKFIQRLVAGRSMSAFGHKQPLLMPETLNES